MSRKLTLPNGATVRVVPDRGYEAVTIEVVNEKRTASIRFTKNRPPEVIGLRDPVPRDTLRLVRVRNRPDWVVVKGMFLGEELPYNAICAINTRDFSYHIFRNVDNRIRNGWNLEWEDSVPVIPSEDEELEWWEG